MDALGLSEKDDNIHLVNGDGVAGLVRDIGASQVIAYGDTLAYGPCSPVASEHARLRHRLHSAMRKTLFAIGPAPSAVLGVGELRRALRNWAGNEVVIWSSAAWGDALFTAWAVDALVQCDVEPEAIRVAPLPGTPSSPERHIPERLAAAARNARSLDATGVRRLARFWRAFAGSRPDLTWRMLPELAQALAVRQKYGRTYAYVFPALSPGRERSLRLSEADRSLLGGLSNVHWRSLSGMLAESRIRRRLLQVMNVFGDQFVPYRLSAWVAGEAVERRVVESPQALIPQLEFRLTAAGKELLARGLPNRSAVPSLFVGGYDVALGGRGWAARRKRGTVDLAPATRIMSSGRKTKTRIDRER